MLQRTKANTCLLSLQILYELEGLTRSKSSSCWQGIQKYNIVKLHTQTKSIEISYTYNQVIIMHFVNDHIVNFLQFVVDTRFAAMATTYYQSDVLNLKYIFHYLIFRFLN